MYDYPFSTKFSLSYLTLLKVSTLKFLILICVWGKISHLKLYFRKLSLVLNYNTCMRTACHSVICKIWYHFPDHTTKLWLYIYIIYTYIYIHIHIRISKAKFKCTLVCRHLVLRWKISSNKICRSQREQVRTSSTILFQISNFDSKLHLKRRYFLLKKKNFWILVCRLHPKMILPINFWLIIPNTAKTIQS